jgi:hypothetical protein
VAQRERKPDTDEREMHGRQQMEESAVKAAKREQEEGGAKGMTTHRSGQGRSHRHNGKDAHRIHIGTTKPPWP